MGMLAPKEQLRVHLDNDVLVGLARDDVSCEYVGRLRDHGAKVYLSPNVVHEMARAGRKNRGRLIDAALRFCDGVTNMQALDIVEAEVRALIRGGAMPTYPYDDVRSVRDLEQVRSDVGRIEVLGDWGRHAQEMTKPEWATFLQGFVEDIDDATTTKVRQFETYRDFLSHRWGVFRGTLDAIVTPLFMAEGIKMSDHGKIADSWRNAQPMHGVLIANTLITANIYRRARSDGKAAGCMTDLRNIVEAAHGDRFLTRDKDLFECGKLSASVTTNARLRIELVPSP